MSEDTRKVYNVLVTYLQPSEGTLTIAAKSKEEACELVAKLLKETMKLEIVDSYETKECDVLTDAVVSVMLQIEESKNVVSSDKVN